MKIAIVHQFLDLLGGAEKTTITLIEALKNTEHTVILYTTTETDIIESKNLTIRKINSYIPYLWKLKKLYDNKRIYATINDEDVILVMDGGFAFRYMPKKINILYCHSTFEFENRFIYQKIPGWRGILYKIIQSDLKKNLGHIGKKNVKLIANSEFTKKTISELFGIEANVIYPPVNLKEFDSNVQKQHAVISVTRYSPEKNLLFLCNVLKSSKFTFNVIGNSKLKQIEFFNNLKKELNSYKNIHLHNNITREHLIENLKAAKVYFHPSKETFGISVVEAIAAGCIPIVPDNSAHKETVPFKELRFLENDVNDAITKINYAMEGKFDKFIPALKEHAKKFDSDKFQKQMLEFIDLL
jgi:hypothetical protein